MNVIQAQSLHERGVLKPSRYRFGLVIGNNKYGDWTGVFDDLGAALAWHEKHGEFWKDRGRNLKLLKVN